MEHEKNTKAFTLPKISAFTLAEVLITLSIIGVVAALTIPSVISRNNEAEIVTKVKKAYSTLSQAYNMAIAQNGGLNLTGSNGTSEGALSLANNFIPYLHIMKSCGTGTGCFPNVAYKSLDGGDNYNTDTWSARAKYRLTDGSSIYFQISDKNCTGSSGNNRLDASVCGYAGIDINGDKKPNTIGKDTFAFYITKTGIIPMGTVDETSYSIGSCNTKDGYGWGCAAWVVLKGNQDYLKRTISWEE